MKNKAFGHPGLMIASLIIAFAIWLVVVNTSNPEITHTFSGVTVNITNASYVESRQQMYAMIDGIRTISVTVHANRRTVERLNSTNISATADLTQIVDFTSPVYVPVNVTVPGVSVDDVSVNPRMLEITLEDIETKEFVVNPTTGGSTPSKGYEVGKLTASPDKIKIKGPKSLIDRIDQVNAEVLATGLRSDQTLASDIVIFDRNGDALTAAQMESLTIGDGNTTVRVKVTLYSVITDVAIRAETYGSPAPGYQVGDITTTPSTLKVVGDAESLETFRDNGNIIEIPESSHDVDITGASSDQDISVDITNYLPSGISLAADTAATVVVGVKILPFNSKSVEIDTKGIIKKNIPKDYTAVFNDSKLDIRVTGDDASLEILSPEDITASVDLRNVEPGEISIPVEVSLPEGYRLTEEVSAGMTISKVTTEKQESGSPDNQN